MMSRLSDEKTIELLRDAIPATAHDGPATELWPRVRSRMAQGGSRAPAADRVLAIALALLCLLRPSLAGILLVHF